MSFSLLAQAVGFLRTLVIAALFGVSIDLDAYYLALILPGLIAGIVGGALQGGFVPVYVRLTTCGAGKQAAALRGAVTWLLAAGLALISLTAAVSAPLWVPWLAAGGDATLEHLAVSASRVVALSIVLTCVSDFLGLILNCHRRFALAAAAPIANTLVSVPLLIWVGPTVAGLAVSVVAGAMAQLVVVALGLGKNRLALPFPCRLPGADLSAVIALARPMVLGFVFTQLQVAYIQALPAMLGPGALSIFGYASRLQAVVEQVFVIGLGTVLLPHLAELVTRGDQAAISKLNVRIGLFAFGGAMALAGGIWLLGDWAVHLLLGRGQFDAGTSAAVARIWLYLALSAFPFTLSTILSKLIMALGRPRILSITAALVLGAVYGIGTFAPGAIGLAGVALVVVVAQCVRLLAYAVSVRPYLAGQDKGGAAPALRS